MRAIRLVMITAAVLTASAVTGCSSAAPSVSSNSSTAAPSSGGGSDYAATLAAGYRGDYQQPPTQGPAAQTGKNVWFISCGQAYEACSKQSTDFRAAGDKLGWRVTVQDGKADPNTAAGLIRQAVAARVDGVALSAYDCPGIKTALQVAKSANVPVVGLESLDCDNAVFQGSDPALFAGTTKLRGSGDPSQFFSEWARARARYAIASTAGKGKVIQIYEDSQVIQQANGKAFADEFQKCSGCKLKRVAFTFSQVPNPAAQVWKSALLANPTYDIVENSIDSLMFLGLQTATSSAGRPIKVYGAELNPSNIGLVRQGDQALAVAIPYGWFAWATADTLNRVLAGTPADQLPNQGTGWQLVDKEHNLPSDNNYEPPVDYRASYGKIWGGK